MTEEIKQLLWDAREFIADLCDVTDEVLPIDLIHRISVALGEAYE
jgi:hypothetical protein